MLNYNVVVADPPWKADDQLPGPSRGAGKNYNLMSFKEIEDYYRGEKWPHSVGGNNCVLFLWRVAWAQEEALRVCRAWGFVPTTEIVWQKLTKKGKKWFGMGHYVRGSHETAIIAVRGSCPPKIRNVRSTFEAPVPVDDDGNYIHSAKPEEFYDLVEQLYDGPYIEAFARRRRENWTCIGEEVDEGSEVGRVGGKAPRLTNGGAGRLQISLRKGGGDEQGTAEHSAFALHPPSRTSNHRDRQGDRRGFVRGLFV